MHLGGLLSTQEARVPLGYRLARLLRFFNHLLMVKRRIITLHVHDRRSVLKVSKTLKVCQSVFTRSLLMIHCGILTATWEGEKIT